MPCHNFSQQPRKRLRLKEYDYSLPAYYFVTICIHNRLCLFGQMKNDVMILNSAGLMVERAWYNVANSNIVINSDELIVMPNHVHGIIEIRQVGNIKEMSQKKKGRGQRPAPTLSLPEVMRCFKRFTTRQYIDGVNKNNWLSFDRKLWQRSYWEHIIRDEDEYLNIKQYIKDNPKNWQVDKLFEA